MADTNEVQVEEQVHENTFEGFTAMMKWGTVVVFLVAALVVFLIAPHK